ncbi:MAG: light-harvesting antenna LH1, beta subunit [Pseudomonadota bacterium]
MPDGDVRLYKSGLSENEAKEVHGLVMQTAFIYVGIALIAHFLVWTQKPWFVGWEESSVATDVLPAVQTVLTALT